MNLNCYSALSVWIDYTLAFDTHLLFLCDFVLLLNYHVLAMLMAVEKKFEYGRVKPQEFCYLYPNAADNRTIYHLIYNKIFPIMKNKTRNDCYDN
ncbi:hypothetical protein V8C42DRAFT_7869 [Trichoderma barbatum]